MAVDLVSARPDIFYLRRRLKVGEQVVSTAPVAKTDFLNLKRNTDGSAVTAADKAVKPKPSVTERTVLTLDEPVVRLNSRQSAIGSLVASGVTVYGWETAERRNGLVRTPVAGQQQLHKYEVPLFGNRALIEFFKGDVIVSLRYFKKLRRLVLGAESGVITIKLLDGNTIALDTNGGKNVAYLSVIGNVIEVRIEELITDIDGTFSITKPHGA